MALLHVNKEIYMTKKLIAMLCFLMQAPVAGALYASSAVEEMIMQAENARKEAAALGFEWRDTATLIAEAQDLHKKGDEENALAVAKAALLEAEQATLQARYMKKHWKEFIPEE